MPPSLALGICWIVIIWAFYKDHRGRPNCSKALWIPVVWLLLLGSRPLSFWLNISGGGGDLEGSPVDRAFYMSMMLMSFVVLLRRGFNFGAFVSGNKPLCFFYLFLVLTILWADYPFVAFKRWFKEVGSLGPILIILTEEYPLEALEAVFLRCAYVLLPLSVIFIKYVPELGRRFSPSGGVEYTGVADQKNDLGEIVMIFSIVIVWSILRRFREDPTSKWWGFRWPLMVLAMGVWLLNIADSKTAILCLVCGLTILLSDKIPVLKRYPKFVLISFIIVLPVFKLADSVLHISPALLHMLGRDPTFTGRTDIWAVLQDHPVNPLLGCGYQMYWDVNKTVEIGQYHATFKTIHNGYLETYLDGGYAGLAALFFLLIRLGIRVGRSFLSGSDYGKLPFAFFMVTLFYNLSESVFARHDPLWIAFLLVCINPESLLVNRRRAVQAQPAFAPAT